MCLNFCNCERAFVFLKPLPCFGSRFLRIFRLEWYFCITLFQSQYLLTRQRHGHYTLRSCKSSRSRYLEPIPWAKMATSSPPPTELKRHTTSLPPNCNSMRTSSSTRPKPGYGTTAATVRPMWNTSDQRCGLGRENSRQSSKASPSYGRPSGRPSSKPHTFKPQRTNIAPCYNAYQQSKTCRPNGSSFCTVPALGATTFFACFGPKSSSLLPKPTTQPSPSPSPSFWTWGTLRPQPLESHTSHYTLEGLDSPAPTFSATPLIGLLGLTHPSPRPDQHGHHPPTPSQRDSCRPIAKNSATIPTPPAKLLDSQSGPHASRAFTTTPFGPDTTYQPHIFRILLLRRLRLALPLSARRCRCCRILDPLGDHRSACAQAGVLRSRGVPLEKAATRVCREAGARMTTNTRLMDLNIDNIQRQDDRRIIVIANGLPLWGGVPLAIDTTLVSPLTRASEPRSRAGRYAGAAVQDARRAKESACPELLQTRRCKLVVLAIEVGGRWSQEATTFLRLFPWSCCGG